MPASVICFGQQPCGFLPKRYLAAKIATARRLQQEIGGEIVFFLHDSDHDPRETCTMLHELKTGTQHRLNFQFANKIQKQFSPLFAKRVLPDWKEKTARQLPAFVPQEVVEHFKNVEAQNAAAFCVEMYQRLGLLDGIRVERSSDPAFRSRAAAVDDYFVDVRHDGELVRARRGEDCLLLHKGGDAYIRLPLPDEIRPEQISPTRDTRLRWMQSVIGCTHYVNGAGELQYLNRDDAPEVQFVTRQHIDEPELAWVPA
jgi:hypothetical protein